MEDQEFIKTRKICLQRSEEKGNAFKACAALKGIHGILEAKPIADHRIKMTYSLEILSFELIEELLKELGFKLDRSLPAFLRRYYYQYMEDTAREKLVIDTEKQHLTCSVEPQELTKPKQYWDEYH